MSLKSVALLAMLAGAAHGYYINPSMPEASQLPATQDLPSTDLPKTAPASPSQQYQHNEPAAVAFWADRVKTTEDRVESTPSSTVGNVAKDNASPYGDSWLGSLEKMVDPYVTEAVTSTTEAPQDSTTAYTTVAPTSTTEAAQDSTTASYTTVGSTSTSEAAQDSTTASYTTVASTSTSEVAQDSTTTAYTTLAPTEAAQDSTTTAYTTVAPTEVVASTTQAAQDPASTQAPTSQYELNDDAAAAYWAARIKEMMTTQSPLDQESIYEPTAAPTEGEQLLTGGPSQDASSTSYATTAASQDPIILPATYQAPQPVMMPVPQQNQQPFVQPMFVYVPQQQYQQPMMPVPQPVYQTLY
jgi:hypothetical protein